MLFLYCVKFIVREGQICGERFTRYAYAHDEAEARAVADRDIFSQVRASDIAITAMTEPVPFCRGTLVPRIEQPFNGGYAPEHTFGKEAYTL